MARLTVAPFVLKDVVLTLGDAAAGDDYAAHVSTVTFVPATSAVTWQGLSPDASFTDSTAPSWSCTLTYAQDWEDPTSLANYLFENAGDRVPATFVPRNGLSPSFTATVILVAGTIGGDVNTVAVATVTLGVVGEPVKVTTP
jgi:hypothetical protein